MDNLFENLFIFDLANNHQWDYGLASQIIQTYSDIILKSWINGCIKFQFRDLKTFIHPSYLRSNHKYVNRFLSSQLSNDDFQKLTTELKRRGIKTMCTPFDEESVHKIVAMDIDIIKIWSCSALDWKLLQSIIQANKPIICSVGWLSIQEIQGLVDFFQSHNANYALLHCIALYPTPNDSLELNFIDRLKKEFPDTIIGYSTHEDPNNFDSIKIAYAKWARIFEKHISIEGTHTINQYSLLPKQAEQWIFSYEQARLMCWNNSWEIPKNNRNLQTETLHQLKRWVFAVQHIYKWQRLTSENTQLAFPLIENQLSWFEWKEDMFADRDYVINDAIIKPTEATKEADQSEIRDICMIIKEKLAFANIVIPADAKIILSFHEGFDKFLCTGCVQILCFDTMSYWKKIIILFAGQNNPIHFHKTKIETFQVLSWSATIYNDNFSLELKKGQYFTIQPTFLHWFRSVSGCIIEEISSWNNKDDSFYISEAPGADFRKKDITNIINGL